MKLTAKIICLVLAVIAVLLAADGYLSVQRDTQLFADDMQNDTLLLGHAMKDLVIDVWRIGGQAQAMQNIARRNDGSQQIRIRWVWLDAQPGDAHEPQIPSEKLAPVKSGRDLTLLEPGTNGRPGYLYTYVPVPVVSSRPSALELCESLDKLAAYRRERTARSIVLAALLALASGIMLLLFGVRMIGRPLEQLTVKANRTGAGDFTGDLLLAGGDELAELATAINRMCAQLAANREAIRTETEARIAALEQLRHTERLATIGRLAAGIAHELGTPLNVVAGRAKLISGGDLRQEQIGECSRIIAEQAARMSNIIRQLLDFARRHPSRKSPCNFAELLRQVLDLLQTTAKKQGVTFELVLPEGRLAPIAVDEAQMQQVLINLIMNGIQAMPDGGRLRVSIRLERIFPPLPEGGREKDYLVIAVADEGEGIRPENIRHLFEPFFTTRGVGEGTGLGLSIAYGIVKEHGGWLDVNSDPGAGACFSVYLPWGPDEK
jgi:two-component system NtrC family sensor kinase